MANPFDFNEVEEKRKFEKSVIFGTSPLDTNDTSEFLKKSRAFNQLNGGDEVASVSVPRQKSLSFIDGDDNLAVSYKAKGSVDGKPNIPKYNSAELLKSARSNHVRASSDFTPRASDEITDVVYNKPQVSMSEYQKVQDELQKAKQTIQILKGQKWSNLPIKETIHNMVTGKSYRLDGYKSCKDKQSLLAEAAHTNDGDTILAVVLFLERTLKPDLFHRELRRVKIASDQYIQYLRDIQDFEQLEEFFKKLLRYEDAALLAYERARLKADARERIEDLYDWIKSYGLKNEVSEITKCVQDEIGLLEKQRQLEEEDKAKQGTGNDIVMKYHERTPVLFKSLVTTVSYCALYHYGKSDKNHPDTFKKPFRLSDKQYEWSVLPPLINRHKWAEVQDLLSSTNWRLKKVETSQIGFENIVALCHAARAGEEIMTKYFGLITNVEMRYKMAARYQAHDVAIQALVELRDRQRMEEYRLKIGGTSSKHRQKINDLLNNSQVKWR